MKNRLACIAVVAVMASTSVVAAHPLPKATSPAPNAVLTTSPSEIRMTFSEPLVAAFSGLELKTQAGAPVAIGASAVDRKDKRQLFAPVTAALAEGTYTVNWRAVAADTHHVAGHFSFQVKP